jgi:phosphatidate cytidylyltransferase
MLSLFLLALFYFPLMAWQALVLAMVMQGTSEWSKLAKLSGRCAMMYWLLTLLIMIGLLVFDTLFTVEQQIWLHLPIYIVAVLFWFIVVTAWLIAGWKTDSPMLMAIVGWAVLIPTGLAMLDLRAVSPWLLLFVMCLVWVADSAAYFAGQKFGKTKLAPSISPGKTWEGVVGAMAAVAVYVVLTWLFAPDLPVFLFQLLLACWWGVGLAVIGDLFESAIKRQAGVKDSGNLLPGHGGLLDRIDALTSTLPLVAMLLLLQRLE